VEHTQRPTTVHIILEFGWKMFELRKKQYLVRKLCLHTDSSFGFLNLSKLDYTTPFRTSAIEENFSELDLASCLKEFDQVLVGGGPWKLKRIQ